MGSNLKVPVNIEDPVVLKRFLTSLVLSAGTNPLLGTSEQQGQAIIQLIKNNPNIEFFELNAKLNQLRNDIITYVEDNVETIVKQNTKDIALVVEQFGTFYEQALAASWYGLSVKAGGAIAGLEIGSLDPDVTTPGDESSYFRVIADNFIIGRAYEDLTQEEKNYLDENGLPKFGTVYTDDGNPIPAIIVTWDSELGAYKHYFNGIVNFNNVGNVPNFALSSDVTATLANYLLTEAYNIDKMGLIEDISNLQNQIDGAITTWFNFGVPTILNYPAVNWVTNEEKNQHLGDIYYDKEDGKAYRFAFEDIVDVPDAGVIYSWITIVDSDLTLALATANEAKATADGKITTFYQVAQPVAEGNGDIWINSTSKLQYVWDGGFWRLIDVAVAINNGTTTINGGRIDTSVIGTGVIYNTGANSSNYTMKIDLNNGEIHIK